MPNVIMGLDLARPGSDMTVLATMRDGILDAVRIDLPPETASRTAIEVEHRLAEHMKTHGHLYERMRNRWPIRSVLDHKVPLIKYGRRKRRYRRLFPRVPDVKIVI